MAHASFVHLRVHSAYSLSEGAIKINKLIELAKKHAMPAVAITDTANMFGALEFAMASAEAGLQPIIGCQIAVKRMAERGVPVVAAHNAHYDQLVLLVQSETGYRNLLRLVSDSYLAVEAHEPPHTTLERITDAAEGLIALAGGPAGHVGRLLQDGQDEAAGKALAALAEVFPARLYVELMRHGLAAERRIETKLIDLAYARALPLVATNDVFFADVSMFEAHDALLCIAEKTFVAEAERRRATPEHRFKSAEEMRALFADIPEAIDNTLVVARRCAFMPEKRLPILPAFPVPTGGSEADELCRQAREGLDARLAKHVFVGAMDEQARAAAAQPYRERLDYELAMIAKMGFPGYFLIVADFIQWARRNAIPVGPGRGSGAGSVVAWSLTITDLDPLRFGLLFERFLNPERVSMPDFDIDFCQDRRDEVIRYVQDKYGRDRVAQIITFGELKARAALRDVGRVLQMPYGQIDRLCKLVPNNPAAPVTLDQAIAGEPELRNQRDSDETVARLIDIARQIEGLLRHASTHAAGVVIGDRPLNQLVPLYRDRNSDAPVTQFNMKYVEQAGLVKFDFLGLKTLTVLARCLELLQRRDIALDLSALPLDDKATFEMLGRADVTGVFQLESSGMRHALRQLRADRFEDIIALVALYRPGPMDNIPRYIACKHGDEQPDYLHPMIEAILKETFGVIIYQEQVMQIAQVLSGYTLGAADLLRRAMGKKIKSEMAAQRQNFVNGAIGRGVEKARAALIFDLVDKFAGYGFNKSHAAAYAMVAYQTAYLKANHPVEFLAASMTLDMGDTDKLGVFRQELDRLGIKLLPPDVNASEDVFAVEELPDGTRAVRYALAAVRNVGRTGMQSLVAERMRAGPFASLADFAMRVDARAINKRMIENLICAGAFDGLEPSRARGFAGAEAIIRRASQAAQERESRQTALFGGAAGDAGLRLPDEPAWSDADRLRREFEAIGFYLSAHPLDAYAGSFERLGAMPFANLARHLAAGGPKHVKLVGTSIGRRERTSQKGSRYAFVQFSDTSGFYEAVMFSEALAAARDMLDSGAPLLLDCEARLEEETLRIAVQGVRPLDAAVADTPRAIRVYVSAADALPGLKGVMSRDARGRGRLSLVVSVALGREVEIALPGRFALAQPTCAALKSLPGVLDVREI
ncbi:MAG: DNA polymerase III subunit alpha [Alphaproteobacteria bacterium]